jgi:predicted DNA-binding protein
MGKNLKESIRRYQKENREQVRLDVPKGTKEKYKAFAEKHGMSMTAFITELVEAEIEKDGEFASAWQAKIKSEKDESDAAKQSEIDRIKADTSKKAEPRKPIQTLPIKKMK